MIHILDKQTDLIVGFLENKLQKKIYWNDLHKDSKNQFETFDFTARADVKGAEHLTGQNRVLIPGDMPGTWREFVIFDTFRQSGGTVEVKCNGSYVELAKEPILTSFDLGGVTAQAAMEYGITDTEWELGRVDYAGIEQIQSDDRMDRYSYLLYVAETFGLSLNFRVEIWGNTIGGRYVDLLQTVGADNGKEIILGKDLVNVVRHEATEDIVTALVVEGPPAQNGARVSVTVQNEEAKQRWGRNGRHRWGYYEVDSDNQDITPAEVRELGEKQLNKLINASVQYTVEGVSLEHVFGLSHERALKGDKVRVKDTSFDPPLYLDAEIIDVERTPSNPKIKKFTLGEFIEYTEEEVMATFRKLQRQLADKVGYEELAEELEGRDIIKSPIPPNNPDNDTLWLDTSKSPNVLYRWDGAQWVKSSPTVPEDIGAVPPQYVDMKQVIMQLRIEGSTVSDTKRTMNTEANKLIDNPWLSGLNTVKTDLINSLNSFNQDANNLIDYINIVVSDDQLTPTEESNLDTYRMVYRMALDYLIQEIRNAEDEVVRQSANEIIEFGERKIFKGGTIPDTDETQELDLWLDGREFPPVWRQFINGTWTKVSRTNLSDMQGEIASTQIGDDTIDTPHLRSNAVTSKHISTNTITSNMISTAGLDAGVITYGTMTGITSDVGQAGMTATGSLSTSVRFWAGSTYLNRANAPFIVRQSGAVEASNMTITGGRIIGPSVTVSNAPKFAFLQDGELRLEYRTSPTGSASYRSWMDYNGINFFTFNYTRTGIYRETAGNGIYFRMPGDSRFDGSITVDDRISLTNGTGTEILYIEELDSTQMQINSNSRRIRINPQGASFIDYFELDGGAVLRGSRGTANSSMFKWTSSGIQVRTYNDGGLASIVASNVGAGSDPADKEDVHDLGRAIGKVRGMKLYDYKRKDPSPGWEGVRQLGLMLDEAPEEVTGPGAVDLYSYISLVAKAVQELSEVVETAVAPGRLR